MSDKLYQEIEKFEGNMAGVVANVSLQISILLILAQGMGDPYASIAAEALKDIQTKADLAVYELGRSG